MRRLVQLAIIGVIVYFAVTRLAPIVKQPFEAKREYDSCPGRAQHYVDDWKERLSHFTAAPYDKNYWESTKIGLEERIGDLDHDCSCSLESCTKTRDTVKLLGALVHDMDSTITRNATAPDVSARFAVIDDGLREATRLFKDGK